MVPTICSRSRKALLGALLMLLAHSPALWAADEAKRVVALIDYIGGDYRNAVQDGKVVNADEYTEMTEFSARSLELFKQLKSAEGDKAGIEKDLNALAAHIKSKTGDDAVPQLAQQIKERLIKTYSIVDLPQCAAQLRGRETSLHAELRAVPRRQRQRRRSRPRVDESKDPAAGQFHRRGFHGGALAFQSL